jgi:flagellar assembly factor FliW
VNFFPDYAPKIDQRVLALLGCSDAEDVVFYVILSVAASLVDATANLRAPIAMSLSTRRAAQIVLDDDALSFREPLAR